jgi:hypothetical protein
MFNIITWIYFGRSGDVDSRYHPTYGNTGCTWRLELASAFAF